VEAKQLALGDFGADPVFKSATIEGVNDIYRPLLCRQWGPEPPCLFVGHNPSTADALAEDPTTRRWAAFARRWGRGGYYAVNLYPYRATDVSACYTWRDGRGPANDIEVGIMMAKNIDLIFETAQKCMCVVVCWGDLAREQGVVEAAIRRLRASGKAILCFGYTKSGAPKHVMARGKSRVPDDFQPIPYPPLG
jgi:hypothetical protein